MPKVNVAPTVDAGALAHARLVQDERLGPAVPDQTDRHVNQKMVRQSIGQTPQSTSR